MLIATTTKNLDVRRQHHMNSNYGKERPTKLLQHYATQSSTPKSDMKPTETNHPELKDEDTYAKNAASARKVGDGSALDCWLWTFGRLKGLNDGQKAVYSTSLTTLGFSD